MWNSHNQGFHSPGTQEQETEQEQEQNQNNDNDIGNKNWDTGTTNMETNKTNLPHLNSRLVSKTSETTTHDPGWAPKCKGGIARDKQTNRKQPTNHAKTP